MLICHEILSFLNKNFNIFFSFSFIWFLTDYARTKPQIQLMIHIRSTCVYILRICLPFQTLQLKDSVLICAAISMSQWNFSIITHIEKFYKLFYLRERTNGNCNYDLSLTSMALYIARFSNFALQPLSWHIKHLHF